MVDTSGSLCYKTDSNTLNLGISEKHYLPVASVG